MTLVLLAGCGWHLNGQTSIDLTRQGRLGSGTTLPAQCAAGQVFFKSNAPAGSNLYTCIAQNSWTSVGLSQGAAASRPANCTFGQIWLSTDTGAMTYCSATGNPGTWTPTLAGPAGPQGPKGDTGAAGASQIAAYGTPLTVRPTLNFGAGATCVDNSGANRTDCTFSGGGGGSGSVVLTSGAGIPSANCAAPSSSNLAVYLDTTNQDEWWCSATNTWKKVLSVTGSGPYLVTGGTGAAPSNPASGTVSCYFSSATNTQLCLDSGGNATTMVPVPALPTGTSITLTGTSGIANCTGNCTVTVPLPSPGVVFCAVTDDNVSASITFAALGSGARYESAAHTGYGTAGTGTLAATAAIGNRVCILGRDATHYLIYSATGTWTAN
jgi:hypothetical protein